MEPPSFLNPDNWKWFPHIPSMQDLMNPQKWMGFIQGVQNGSTSEILILFLIVVLLFFVFIWEYIKNNSM